MPKVEAAEGMEVAEGTQVEGTQVEGTQVEGTLVEGIIMPPPSTVA
jgi:hypothetical protein